MVATGNHFFDKVILRLQVAPDGSIDGVPTWSSDNPDLTLTPTADGLTCDVLSDLEFSAPATVTVTAAVDVPATPDLETISESFTCTFSHSKATGLNASFIEVPRV